MGAPDFVLSLGGVDFADFEIPAEISGGGEQLLQIHKYGGGSRTVDAFGPDDADLSWSGTFFDATAEPRCQQLDTLRKLGEPVLLEWSSFSYLVVVKSFTWDSRRFYELPYKITVAVVEDNVQPVTGVDANVDDETQADFDDSNALMDALIEIVTIAQNLLVDVIDLLTLPLEIAGIFSTLGEIASISGASSDQIDGLQMQIDTARATALQIVAASEAAVEAAGDAANFASGTDGAALAQSLNATTSYSATLATVLQLANVLGRLSRNVQAVLSGAPILSGYASTSIATSSSQQGATLAVSPGNSLYAIAALIYGDAAGWALLAKANGLVDPMIQFDMPLTIPAYDAGRAQDGILL